MMDGTRFGTRKGYLGSPLTVPPFVLHCVVCSLTILLTTPSSYPCGWSSPLSSLPFTSSVREEAPPWSSLCPLAPSPWSGQGMELSELRNGVVDERQKGVERAAAEGGYMNTVMAVGMNRGSAEGLEGTEGPWGV